MHANTLSLFEIKEKWYGNKCIIEIETALFFHIRIIDKYILVYGDLRV